MRLSHERESVGRRCSPVLQGLHCGTRAIGVIHFDAVELRRVILEELARWRLSRIEIRFPRRVSPAGGSNVDFAHEKLLFAVAILHCESESKRGLRQPSSGL